MAHKTKAAMQGRQCHYQKLKQSQDTRVNDGGQSLSAPVITGTAPLARLRGDLPHSGFLRRWRRFISPCIAALINCPVLSPSAFTCSIPSMISCGMRAVTDWDFAFFEPVAMSNTSCDWCKTIYTKKSSLEVLTCKTPLIYRVSYTMLLHVVRTEARQWWNTNRASNHNPNHRSKNYGYSQYYHRRTAGIHLAISGAA
ncbi:hypothetical protein EXW94_22530 [Enterobacter sp. JMULE2]|nr:hypothetical protein [Enterobacter sp. JMULE2]